MMPFLISFALSDIPCLTKLCGLSETGLGTEMAKCDIKSVFHLLPVHPQDFQLLGFSFEGKLYMD